ncbi:MAG: pyruvate ferredoxin oxidoreductase, partial [Gemmatimonadetes bacterium]|nr:pyruvate ferredoxin oxidoreductase [Gemmatimonadota bacterium]
RGLGHGNTHAVVLTPSTPQEMLDLTMLAFRLTFKYRNPVVIAADGYLGQITGRVHLPEAMTEPGIPEWAVFGDREHRHNLINSIRLAEADLEQHNERLNAKYSLMISEEQRAKTFKTDDANILVLSCNTPARMAKGAVEKLRREGVPIGLFQPVTLWPFPIDHLKPLLGENRVTDILVVEASAGQLEDELRLALSHAGVHGIGIHHLRRMGGMLPQEPDIVEAARGVLRRKEEVAS